ncbi:uncharacterized protein LOC142465232 [Ascaphus truei]|uniref:uncharacterized protein LOC142465232 n=1 Tax=Ascaphus truei TaxID=8439 RepID=UPI003F594A77
MLRRKKRQGLATPGNVNEEREEWGSHWINGGSVYFVANMYIGPGLGGNEELSFGAVHADIARGQPVTALPVCRGATSHCVTGVPGQPVTALQVCRGQPVTALQCAGGKPVTALQVCRGATSHLPYRCAGGNQSLHYSKVSFEDGIKVTPVHTAPPSAWSGRSFVSAVTRNAQPLKRRNVVKLRYKGAEEMKPHRIFVGKHLLKESLGFSADDIYALIVLYCSCEYDVRFKRPQALDYFWTKYESLKNSKLWKSFTAIPVSKPETKSVTILFRHESVPISDILIWLGRQCEVLAPPTRIMDSEKIWVGGWKVQVRLWRHGNVTKHLPNSFFIGREKGNCFYYGQPTLCHRCGSARHLSMSCDVLKCNLCQSLGHERASCTNIRCNLCDKFGHSYTNCAEAWHNISKVWEQEVDFEDNEALYDRALKVADRICLDPPADGVGLVQPRDGACLDPPGDGACPGPPVDAVCPDTLTEKTIIVSVNKAQEMSEDPLEGTSSNLLPAGEQSGESDDPTLMETQVMENNNKEKESEQIWAQGKKKRKKSMVKKTWRDSSTSCRSRW